MPAASTLKPARLRLPLALLLGALHAWMAASVSDRHSCVYDEPAHLAAGLSYWSEHDFRLQPENGLLPQLWLSLPLHFSDDIRPPATDGPAWKNADIWALGDTLLHQPGNDTAAVLHRARMMNALVGGALVSLIFLWAWSLGGPLGALASGGLAAFSPTLLAHSGLATSDTMGALGLVAATLAYWRLLHRVSAGRIAQAGAAAALLALSKYSAVLFPLIAAPLLLARCLCKSPLPCRGRRLRGMARFTRLCLGSVAAIAVAWSLVWAAYGIRFEARSPHAPADARFIKPWENVLIIEPFEIELTMADGRVPPGHSLVLHPGPVDGVVGWMRDRRLLPEAWLYGLAFVNRHSHFRLAYFCGEWSATGWRGFFPIAYLVKTTPAELFAHLLGATIALGALLRGRRLGYRAIPILTALAVYAAFAISSNLNIGHRHLLPLYALAALLPALLPRSIAPGSRRVSRLALGGALAALVTAQIVSALSIQPSWLAYFNSPSGGPDQGHRYLADSSLDWGQDLPALRDWLAAHPSSEPLYLSYFGNARPERFGIEAERLADESFPPDPTRTVAPAPGAGRYVFSATMWNRVYTQVRGPWTASYESRYRLLRAWLADLSRRGDAALTTSPDGTPMPPEHVHYYLRQYDHLRFGRLVHQLANRPPDARIAHNWFVFDLTASELQAALNGPLLPPVPSDPARPGPAAPPPPGPDRP